MEQSYFKVLKIITRAIPDSVGQKLIGLVTSRDEIPDLLKIPKGWDRLVLSIVSVETGKTIAKANKATVRSGTCQWTEAFSESIWIPHDNASKKVEECVLKIVVSMGSHRSGILGDLTINLTDYLSSRDSGSLPLPLKNCNYGTLLQVRIQCLNPKRGFREVRSSKETSYLEGLRTNNDGADSKSDVSDNMFNRSLGSLSSNHPVEPVNQDTNLSASGSHRSSDSGDSAVGRLNFSPRNNSNGGSYMGRQDSAGSHISAASSAGPADDFSRSNPLSFNSRASGSSTPIRWQESMMQTSATGLAPISRRQSGSSKDFLESAEETIEELQDEAKMWERHAQKLKQDIEKFRKECSDKTKRQAELDLELSVAYSDRNTLKQEVEQLKASLEEATTKQTATRASKNEVMLHVQKEMEDEVKYLKESNANLNLQLNKSQEANLELVSILEELEETVEKQRLEIAKFPQQSPLNESDGDLWSQKLLDVEAEWEAKLSVKEKEIRKLEEKLSGKFNVKYISENESSHGYPDLIEEIEELRGKVLELERDCAELTDENLELIYKMKQSGDDIRGEKDSENSDSEIDFLKSKIRRLEEETRTKEMLNGGQAETSAIQMKNLEQKCVDLEVELQYFKDQAYDLDGKLRDSQLEVEGKISELTELQKKLKNFDTVTALKETEEQERTDKEIAGNKSDIEDLELAFSLKEKEIDILRYAKEELEVLVTNIQRDKCQLEENLTGALRESTITSKCLEDVQHEMTLLVSSVDSHTSTNKMLERKLVELERSKHELEVQVSELEEENVQLSELISGLEAQLRYLTNEKESNRLELEDSRSLVEDLKGEVAKQQTEIETQKGVLKQKLLDAQKRLSETQEETEYLKRSHSKLQSTIESLIEENSLLQKSNGDLRRQKLDLHEHSGRLEVELSEAQKRTSEFLKKVEILEVKFSSMQKDIVLKEKMLTAQLENIFQEHKDQEEKISQAKLVLNQIDVQNTVLVENLKRENAHLSTQLCSTHDRRQRMASDAVLEVSGLRSDKIELESSLQETLAKIELYETELQFFKQESAKKVQGLVDLLNASKQSEETLMSDIENMQRQAEAAKSGEEEFKRLASERELKRKASDYEKQQIIEETFSLKVQVQKIAHLQDEILVLKSALEEVKFEKGKLEESLQLVYEECESLKTERVSFMEKISNMQKALHDGEDEKRNRIALEDKLLRLEGDLSAKEASYAYEAESKNEVNRIKGANNEYQRKIQCLEEKWELARKAQVQKNEENQDKISLDKSGVVMPSSENHDKQSQIQDVEQLADADQTKRMDDSKLRDLESTIRDLEAKIRSLDSELAESVAENNLYKIQLQGLMAEKQSSNSEVPMVSMCVDDIKSQQSKVFSMEAELKDVQHANKIAALEAELKDMRERYLHMSLQYAEVEAQREELVLKLKTTAKGKGWFS